LFDRRFANSPLAHTLRSLDQHPQRCQPPLTRLPSIRYRHQATMSGVRDWVVASHEWSRPYYTAQSIVDFAFPVSLVVARTNFQPRFCRGSSSFRRYLGCG
jgi:hypothetical protein